VGESSTTKARIQLPTWWGNQKDLARLVTLVKSLHSSASAEALEKLTASRAKTRELNEARVESLAAAIATNISKNGGDPGRFADPTTLMEEARILGSLEEDGHYTAERAVKELDLEMAVSLKTWDERRTGSPDVLIEDLDEREVKRIELSFGQQYSGGTFLRLELGKYGSQAELGGPVHWVSSAAGQLKVELKRQSSWLGRLVGSGWGHTLIAVPTAVVIALLLLPYVKSTWDLVAIVLVLNVLVSFVAAAVLQKFIPRFELMKDGKPKIKTWLGWVAGLLGTVIIGLGTNALSKMMGL